MATHSSSSGFRSVTTRTSTTLPPTSTTPAPTTSSTPVIEWASSFTPPVDWTSSPSDQSTEPSMAITSVAATMVEPGNTSQAVVTSSHYELHSSVSKSIPVGSMSTYMSEARVSSTALSPSSDAGVSGNGTVAGQDSAANSGAISDSRKPTTILAALLGLLLIPIIVLSILYYKRRRRREAASLPNSSAGVLHDRRISGAFTLFAPEEQDDGNVGQGGIAAAGALSAGEKRRRAAEGSEDHLSPFGRLAETQMSMVDSDAASVVSETNVLRRKLDGWSALARNLQRSQSNQSPNASTANLITPTTTSQTISPFSDSYAVPSDSTNLSSFSHHNPSIHPSITPFRPPTLPASLAPLHLPITTTTTSLSSQSLSPHSFSSMSPEVVLSPHFQSGLGETSPPPLLARGPSLQARDAGVSLMGHRMDGVVEEQEEAPPAYAWG